MDVARILLIGRVQASQPMAAALEKRYRVLVASSGKQGLMLSKEHPPQVVVLDAASMRTPGDRICLELQQGLQKVPIVHIHPGPREHVQSRADVLLFPPLTTRKLLNVIDRLLQVQDDTVISYGPLSINLERRVLLVSGQETQLTPKQALLVETFLRHPGKTLERKTLMEKVWNTDYLGDTRTLDVHIRWLRQAIETDPGKPRFLVTVRGIGYRLQIPDDAQPIEEAEAVLSLNSL